MDRRRFRSERRGSEFEEFVVGGVLFRRREGGRGDSGGRW